MPPIRVDGAHFSPDTVELIRLLHKHAVRYLVVGGEAVIFHGHSRLTGDVDLFFGTEGDNAPRLFRALDEFWDADIPGIDTGEELLEEDLILQFGQPPNRIDLINRIDGISFVEAWPQRVEATLVTPEGEVPLPFIAIDQLITNKRAAGRPKDLDDLAYLEAAKKKKKK